MVGEDAVPRYRWRLEIVVESIKSNDRLVRGAKVEVGKTRNVIRRPINCLYPTEVLTTEQLYCNIRNVRKTKKRMSVILIRLKLRVQKKMLQLQESCDDD